MATQLTFKSHVLEAVEHDGKSWFTAATLAIALEYSRSDMVGRIYSRNVEEFTPCMTVTLETANLTVSDKSKSYSNLKTKTRIFSLRGAHLIAMFASTPVAKEFRRWVLDLIDKELTHELPSPQKVGINGEVLPPGIFRCNSRKNPYTAQVCLDGKNIHVGVFPTLEDAIAARHEALRRHHVDRVVKNNPDLVTLTGVRTRLLIEFEGTHAESSRILHPDAITATPENLPNVLREYGWGKISIEQHQRIIEACVEVIARKCKLSTK